ncbi:MAG: dTMP kinase [Aquificaceae bacterium]
MQNKLRRGTLVVFEGIDGSGKTTLAKRLYQHLLNLGIDAVLYRDPGSTDLAEKLRKEVLSLELHPITELLIFQSARSDLVNRKILPDLIKDRFVIMDRFLHSSIAYQGFGREINLGTVKILNHIATRGIKPDIVFLLNPPLEVALSRLRTKNRFEDRNFLKRVRDGYLNLANEERELFVLLDTSQSEDLTFSYILDTLIARELLKLS